MDNLGSYPAVLVPAECFPYFSLSISLKHTHTQILSLEGTRKCRKALFLHPSKLVCSSALPTTQGFRQRGKLCRGKHAFFVCKLMRTRSVFQTIPSHFQRWSGGKHCAMVQRVLEVYIADCARLRHGSQTAVQHASWRAEIFPFSRNGSLNIHDLTFWYSAERFSLHNSQTLNIFSPLIRTECSICLIRKPCKTQKKH